MQNIWQLSCTLFLRGVYLTKMWYKYKLDGMKKYYQQRSHITFQTHYYFHPHALIPISWALWFNTWLMAVVMYWHWVITKHDYLPQNTTWLAVQPVTTPLTILPLLSLPTCTSGNTLGLLAQRAPMYTPKQRNNSLLLL